MNATTTADVIVVGLGAVGSALSFHLARAGARVVGIDRFHPPHEHGSSHGLTRITRLAVGEGEAFVPLVARSHALWRELEQRTGQELYRRTGGLVIGSDAADLNTYHGRVGFLAHTIGIAREHGIAHDLLDAAQVRERFPAFRLRDDERAYHEHDAGVLFPERCVAAHLDQALLHGATFRMGERVLDFAMAGSDTVVTTDQGRVTAPRVVVTAGAWLPGMAGDAMASKLRVMRQVLYWYRSTEPQLFDPATCPVYIWVHGAGAAGSLYGFPMIDGVAGAKIATEQDDTETHPDQVDRTVHDEEVDAMYETHVRGRLPSLTRDVVRTATCLYTCTRDAAFLVRPHPQSPAVTLVSACSGHGFKHSAGLGEALAERVLQGRSSTDISAFCAAD